MEWTKTKPIDFGLYWYLVDRTIHPNLRPEFYEPVVFDITLDADSMSRRVAVNVSADVECPLEDDSLDGFWCKCQYPALPWETDV